MKWLALILIPFALTACDSTLTFLAGEGWQPQGNAFKNVNWQGTKADATTLTFVTARNQGEWQNLWERVRQDSPGELPQGKMAVAVLAGQKPNAGYSVDITSATRENQMGRGERFIVKYIIRPPVEGKVYSQQLSSPWAIRMADASEVTPVYSEIKLQKKAKKKPKPASAGVQP